MKVYSFDIYDTVLTRVVEKPTDIFRLLQKRVSRSKKLPESVLQSIFDGRIWAEFLARRLTENEDVTLKDIYVVMRRVLSLTEEHAHFLMQHELDLEKDSIAPIQSTISRISHLKAEGSRIIYISDMYLPADFIENLLRCYCIFDNRDSLYVSGEAGMTKGSGKLFDYVLEKERIAPHDLVHVGDNPHSDVAVPRSRNIRAFGTEALKAPPRLLRMLAMVQYLMVVVAAKTRLEVHRAA